MKEGRIQKNKVRVIGWFIDTLRHKGKHQQGTWPQEGIPYSRRMRARVCAQCVCSACVPMCTASQVIPSRDTERFKTERKGFSYLGTHHHWSWQAITGAAPLQPGHQQHGQSAETDWQGSAPSSCASNFSVTWLLVAPVAQVSPSHIKNCGLCYPVTLISLKFIFFLRPPCLFLQEL